MLNGLIPLPWWGHVLVTLAMTHVTIAAVTIFLHRAQAHRALELHPMVAHFFRFWLWLSTGMVTKVWVAVHRKHHAKCETDEDPHSPQVRGLSKVLWQGAELYKAEGSKTETLARYGTGTPDDWLERRLYAPHSGKGVLLMLGLDLLLFGPVGLTIWAVQMLWIPFFAAGVINGLGHYWGYRNFSLHDASTNILPWGILIGGEELHNNHHAYGYSAKLSSRWYEFDIGWFYIRTLAFLRLARVRRVAPRLRWGRVKAVCDQALLQAIIVHRRDVLARYGRIIRKVYLRERARLARHLPDTAAGLPVTQLRRWFSLDAAELKAADLVRLRALLAGSPHLDTLYRMRRELAELWGRSGVNREQLVDQLQDWCQRAERSGIAALAQFSLRLRRYA